MRTYFKRCVSVLIVFVLLFLILPGEAKAEITIEKRKGAIWNAVYLWPEEEKVKPTIVVIYLHGSSNYGKSMGDLVAFDRCEHPVKYAREGKLYLPDNVVFVCPQAKVERDFRDRQSEKLLAYIEEIRAEFLGAKLILAGHSLGAISIYKFVSNGYDPVDGYVFISGHQSSEPYKLPFITNAFVAFGAAESSIDRRGDFSALYEEHAISSRTYRQESYLLEEESHNAYMAVPGGHAWAVRVILQEFFWEWLNSFVC